MNTDELKGEPGKGLAYQAIDKAVDLDLTVTPQNYEIWLNYFGDWVPGLRKDVDDVISKAGHFSEDKSEELYERYFSTAKLNNDVVEAGARIAAEISEALSTLKTAGIKTEAFGEQLDGAATTLSNGDMSHGQLQKLVSELTEATKDMAEQNKLLGEQLKSSGSEVEQLRTNLQEARAAALTDGLTGIANRKMFDETLRFRKKEAGSLGYPLTLAICDIDKFKSFNDTWGHQTGDQVIRFVASTLQRLAMEDHLVARYGGEEFAIIMPRISLGRSLPILERMRRAVEAKQLMRKSTNESLGSVTISFGVATLTETDTIQSIIERADECLYASKRNGRNQITSEDRLQTKAA